MKKVPHSPETQFKPGQSGNPAGRPKKLPAIDDLLIEVLGDSENSEAAKAIIEALKKKAMKGDVRAIEVLLDRGWGKARQSMTVESEISVTVKHES